MNSIFGKDFYLLHENIIKHSKKITDSELKFIFYDRVARL